MGTGTNGLKGEIRRDGYLVLKTYDYDLSSKNRTLEVLISKSYGDENGMGVDYCFQQ